MRREKSFQKISSNPRRNLKRSERRFYESGKRKNKADIIFSFFGLKKAFSRRKGHFW